MVLPPTPRPGPGGLLRPRLLHRRRHAGGGLCGARRTWLPAARWVTRGTALLANGCFFYVAMWYSPVQPHGSPCCRDSRCCWRHSRLLVGDCAAGTHGSQRPVRHPCTWACLHPLFPCLSGRRGHASSPRRLLTTPKLGRTACTPHRLSINELGGAQDGYCALVCAGEAGGSAANVSYFASLVEAAGGARLRGCEVLRYRTVVEDGSAAHLSPLSTPQHANSFAGHMPSPYSPHTASARLLVWFVLRPLRHHRPRTGPMGAVSTCHYVVRQLASP